MTTRTTADLRQRAYDYYARHPEITLGAIASILGVSRCTFLRLRKKWGWPSRRELLNGGVPPDAAPASARETLRDAALSLAQVTRTRIDALVGDQHAARTDDHDRTARTLASYARTLAAAQSLLEQEGKTLDGHGQPDKPARSLHELRDELARHLERVIAEEEARGRDGLLV